MRALLVVGALLVAGCTGFSPSEPGSTARMTSSTADRVTPMRLDGVLVARDDVSLTIVANGRNECFVTTAPEVRVSERADEVRIEATERELPRPTTTGAVGCAAVGGPSIVELPATLAEPLGTRTIVDETTDATVTPVRAVELLAPVPIPDGWESTDRQFSGNADGAAWSIRIGPRPQGMFYGVSIAMAWGARCADFAVERLGIPPAPPMTVRGREATVGYGHGSVLSWTEGASCVQLMGFSACAPPDGCRSVDPNQLAALAETLVAGAWS